MIAITDDISLAIEELLGRASGPLHLRLIIQPIVASILAIKAGLRDARAGNPPFLWAFFHEQEERRRLIRSGWEHIGKLFTIAFLFDTAYQIFVLHGFHILQSLIVATVVAVVPYITLRGIVTRLARTKPKAPPASRAA
jgi:hypothetical protein